MENACSAVHHVDHVTTYFTPILIRPRLPDGIEPLRTRGLHASEGDHPPRTVPRVRIQLLWDG